MFVNSIFRTLAAFLLIVLLGGLSTSCTSTRSPANPTDEAHLPPDTLVALLTDSLDTEGCDPAQVDDRDGIRTAHIAYPCSGTPKTRFAIADLGTQGPRILEELETDAAGIDGFIQTTRQGRSVFMQEPGTDSTWIDVRQLGVVVSDQFVVLARAIPPESFPGSPPYRVHRFNNMYNRLVGVWDGIAMDRLETIADQRQRPERASAPSLRRDSSRDDEARAFAQAISETTTLYADYPRGWHAVNYRVHLGCCGLLFTNAEALSEQVRGGDDPSLDAGQIVMGLVPVNASSNATPVDVLENGPENPTGTDVDLPLRQVQTVEAPHATTINGRPAASVTATGVDASGTSVTFQRILVSVTHRHLGFTGGQLIEARLYAPTSQSDTLMP
ncbi:MAG: hypothetical protein GVY18_03050, partial [Bacteroidetes bacterium]|nr:hypothetical protein [Bacteroidota bacterium]